jgi:hypothetical protein
MTKVACIVGNGVSRKNIDLNSIVGQATIFGCNALYRDFDGWDYLVSIDQGMVREVRNNAEYSCKGHVIVPPEHEHWEDAEYSPNRRRSNAGMNAMREAIKKEYDTLYCLGFDFLLDGDISVDNVYRNTENYGPETHASKGDNYYRVKYLEWFVNKYSDVKFVFVYPDHLKSKQIDAENFYVMDESVFISKLT